MIENGYVVPFHSTPSSMFCKNIKFALRHKAFVLEAIKDLVKTGLIARCPEKPYIVIKLRYKCKTMAKNV